MADETKYPHRITKVGANHTIVDENGDRKPLGQGDTIMLTREQAASGRYNNLNPVEIHGHDVDTGTGDKTTDDDFEDHETLNPKGPVKSPQGALSSQSDPAAADGDEDVIAEKAAADEDKDDTDDTTADESISAEDLQDLIDEVEDSKVADGTFEAARKRVIAADLFEADTLPETKSGVLEALKSLKSE